MKKLFFILFIIIALIGIKIALVTIPIVEDKGIKVSLPPWDDEEVKISEIESRNVSSIIINKSGVILINDQQVQIQNIKSTVKEFILNPKQDSNFAESPAKATIFLENEKGATPQQYLDVYNEVKSAYIELWDTESQKQFGKRYSEELSFKEKKVIKEIYPFVLIEK